MAQGDRRRREPCGLEALRRGPWRKFVRLMVFTPKLSVHRLLRPIRGIAVLVSWSHSWVLFLLRFICGRSAELPYLATTNKFIAPPALGGPWPRRASRRSRVGASGLRSAEGPNARRQR